MRRIKKYYPPKQLREIIDFYYEIKISDNPNRKERIVPDANFELILNYGSPIFTKINHEFEENPTCFIAGMHKKAFTVINSPLVNYIGAVFKPGGLRRLTYIPIYELTSKIIPAEVVFGKMINEYYELIGNTIGSESKMALLSELFVQTNNRNKNKLALIDVAIQKISSARGNISIQEVTKFIKINDRYFRKLFSDEIGMNPKKFCEIVKLKHALDQLLNEKSSIIDVCYSFDYFDLAHFNRSFKRVLNISPSKFLNETNPIANLYHSNTLCDI